MRARSATRILLAGALWLAAGCTPVPDAGRGDPPPVSRVSEALGGADTDGYRRAERPREFGFPRDHGPHDGFRNEWWYLTGNLEDGEGNRYGFHVTFFRVALAPAFSGDPDFPHSPWTTRHLWMGHSAVTDAAGRRHMSEERFAREALGLAGASMPVAAVWLEDWRLAGLDGDVWSLEFSSGPFGLSLELSPLREPELQGNAGLSQKGREPGNASYYYSVPRIAVTGGLRDEHGQRRVSGQAWLDREWSTSALDENQVGWDWFALQLDDGTDIMYYQLRQADGSADPLSKGRWMPREGEGRLLTADAVRLEPLRFARAASGNRYPVAWRVEIPELGIDLRIEPVLDDQEMQSFIRYWEGAVDLLDREGRPVGRGFVELTGYESG